jgi:tRNA-uridine 2-sulfurtransferase
VSSDLRQKKQHQQKVLVALSGGVASAVTAALLKSQGFEVSAVHFQFCEPAQKEPIKSENFDTHCSQSADLHALKQFCKRLDISCELIGARDAFVHSVMDHFVHESLLQRIPNPCVQCNQDLKLRLVLARADALGIERVATGHYVQAIDDISTGFVRLKKSAQVKNDQSHLLFGIDQKALKRLMFPLGGIPDSMIRRLAQEFGMSMPVALHDGECLINDERQNQFLASRIPTSLRSRGIIRTLEGHVVGEHEGLYQYRIGQQKGFQIALPDSERFYVVGFDLVRHALIVGAEKHLFHKSIIANKVSWIRPMDGLHAVRCSARIGSANVEPNCRVTLFENDTVHVEFEETQRAMSPGQTVVFYQDDELIGGGYIDRLGVI